MHDSTQKHSNQLKLSILVVAYNQAMTIERAVESAFAQNAKDLEIILADDASDDNTFSIMMRMANSYSGPHQVRCIQQNSNKGLNMHLNALVEVAQCELIMVMAGDDISYTNRAQKIIDTFSMSDVILIHSLADTMDLDGIPINNQRYSSASFFASTDPYRIANSRSLYLGASVAFHKILFQKYGPLPDSCAFEDLVLGFRAALERRVGYIDEPLLCYRIHSGTKEESQNCKTNNPTKTSRTQTISLRLDVLEQRLQDARTFGEEESGKLIQSLKKAISRAKARRDYLTGGPFSGSEGVNYQIEAVFCELWHSFRAGQLKSSK